MPLLRTTTYAIALASFALGIAQSAHKTADKPKPEAAAQSRAARPDQIGAVAFSPNGQLVAAGGYKIVTIFDAATGKQLTQLQGHAGAVSSLAFSPDGKWLAVAGGLSGRSGEVRVWDVSVVKPQALLAGKQTPLVLNGPSDVVYSVAFSPDGGHLAGGSYDHDVTVWDIHRRPAKPASKSGLGRPGTEPMRGKEGVFRDHTDAVYAVAFNNTGRLLASAAGDRTVKVWDVGTGKRLYTLSESTAELYAVAFSPDGKQIAAGGVDKTLRTWNVTQTGGTLAKSAFAHQAAILRVAYSKDGASILTSGEDKAVKRWDAATLAEKKVYAAQPDWPQGLAISAGDKLLAVGCHNGSLTIYDAVTGKELRRPLAGKPVASAAPVAPPATSTIPGRRLGDNKQRRPVNNGGVTLVPASLGNVSPAGLQRGKTVRLTLTGGRISDAMGVYFDDPAITGKIVTPADANKGVLRVDAIVGATARIGVHRVYVQTPHGTTGAVTFAVGAWPEVTQAEPNNAPDSAQKIAFPCTLVGALDQPGDTDCYRFDARAGQELVFEVIAQPIRSRLQPVLRLVDEEGEIVAESTVKTGRPDVLLGHHFDTGGAYVLEVKDFEGAGGGDVHYRINAGELPVVTEVYPLGVQGGKESEVQVKGFNLGGAKTAKVSAPAGNGWGRAINLEMQTSTGPLVATRRLAVGEDPEVTQAAGTESQSDAPRVVTPVTVNGTLWNGKPGTGALSHYYRFSAKKSEPLVIDVMARRLGSPLDSEIEVLDSQGKPVERAVLRAVSQTELTLSDRDSSSSGIRLFAWDGWHPNDYVLIGREVVRILRLPNGPDEDVFFRAYRGQRLGYFGTTPEFHSVSAPAYKVEVHPAGSSFSSNGYPLTRLYYKNDDGGPLFGKDSHLDFVAPQDGEYIVRIADARGQQGADYAYRLMIHPTRPDFKIVMSPEHPNVPKGGAVPVTVECERYDGLDGPIEAKVDGLPAGLMATAAVIEPGETSATFLLSSAPNATTPMLPIPSPVRIVAKATAGGKEIVRTIEPDNGTRLVTVMPDPDVRVTTDRTEVVLRPGEETEIEAQIERGKFGGRIPIDVRNLPAGVRVMNIGLNGVLVTEQDSSRTFSIYCEPWARPQTRPFYVFANVEGGMITGAPPVLLRIEPAKATPKPAVKTVTKTLRR